MSVDFFAFILHWALRHAVRHAEYLTLVTIRESRECVGFKVDANSAMTELAEVLLPMIRDTDLAGELEDGRLGLLLSNADEAATRGVIQRFAATLGQVRFSVPLSFAIGFACCPADGADMQGLMTHALSHRALNVVAPPAVAADSSLSY